MDTDLLFIDEHAIVIAAPRARVWTGLLDHVATSLRVDGVFAALLGTRPAAGFEVGRSVPAEHLALVGRHRFSDYLLAFDLADDGHGTRLSARSYAAFPGVHGWIYRALVIGTGAHVVVTRRVLRSVRTACESR